MTAIDTQQSPAAPAAQKPREAAISDYANWIAKTKTHRVLDAGFKVPIESISRRLFEYQRYIVRWALQRGRAAIFGNTGTGKSIMEWEWCRQVHEHTGLPVLLVTPLCVAHQMVEESARFDYQINYCRSQDTTTGGINITNYEMLSAFDLSKFAGIALDESSILKHATSKTRTKIIELSARIPYRLSCTATPSPNDYMELGNQSEFLGIMPQMEMLAMFFTHDSSNTSKWRLKGHGRHKFFEWMATWAVCFRVPSDLGFEQGGFDLPPLIYEKHIIEAPLREGEMFAMTATDLTSRRKAKKESMAARVTRAAEVINASDEQWIVWCHLNDESTALARAINNARDVKGSDKTEIKVQRIMDFTHGNLKVLISKPSITGFGLNWQHCARQFFVGLNDSFEEFYQAIKRCHRYGQQRPVEVHIAVGEREMAVHDNIERKQQQFEEFQNEMIEHMREHSQRQILGATREHTAYSNNTKMIIPSWLKSESESEAVYYAS